MRARYAKKRTLVDILFYFIFNILLEQSYTDKKIYANSLGEQPPKRKKANSDKDRRIISIVQNYNLYEDDVLTYIDLLKSAM